MIRSEFLVTLAAAWFATPLAAAAEIEPPPKADADWYLVDEIIEDQPPDYRSQIFFADKASMAETKDDVSLSISWIEISEQKNRSWQESIRDMRATMTIDCQSGTYRLIDVSIFDGREQFIENPDLDRAGPDPVTPRNATGFGAIVRFACETGGAIGQRQSPAHMQPLTWLIAYIHADWSK